MEPMGASAGCTDGGLTAADARATHDVPGDTDAVDAGPAGSGVGSGLAVAAATVCSKPSIAAVCGSGGADCGGGGGTTKLSTKASSSCSTCVQQTRGASR